MPYAPDDIESAFRREVARKTRMCARRRTRAVPFHGFWRPSPADAAAQARVERAARPAQAAEPQSTLDQREARD